jgi:hypothetical protein
LAEVKRRKRLPRFSKLGKLKHDVYTAQARKFLKEHPRCQLAINGVPCRRRSSQVHHVRGRGKWHTDPRYFMAICAYCHRWVHTNPATALRIGAIERIYEKH